MVTEGHRRARRAQALRDLITLTLLTLRGYLHQVCAISNVLPLPAPRSCPKPAAPQPGPSVRGSTSGCGVGGARGATGPSGHGRVVQVLMLKTCSGHAMNRVTSAWHWSRGDTCEFHACATYDMTCAVCHKLREMMATDAACRSIRHVTT